MASFRRVLLLAASTLALVAGGLPAVAEVQAPAAIAQAAPDAAWPQASSDIPADPAVRFGVLPNGMRYAILRNATPPNQAALRLRIDAGSLSENEDQLGLAHFLEHMAFNGSNNIPEGEMTRRLERLGLAFGADTNASTSFDQTVYVLNLPNTADETVETSLMALRETAGELLMDAGAIDRERGVIVGEERTRDTPDLRSTKALFGFLAQGQRLADRLPIGDLDIIRTAPRDRFVEFYRHYYRPERATLIAVGDFDVDRIEGQIRSAFESWTNAAPDGPDPDLGQVRPRTAETRIHLEPGTQSRVQIMWTDAPDLAPDTVASRSRDIVRNLGLAVLNRRLGEIARAENPPFIGGGAGYISLFDTMDLGLLTVSFNPGEWRRALEAAEQEQRRLAQYGVGEAELQREITELRTALENAVAGAATRQTPALASGLLATVNQDDVFSTPATRLEIFNAVVETLTVDAVNDAVRDAFEGFGPLAFVTTPVEIAGGEAAVTAALEASRLIPVDAPVIAEALEWPYTDFGPVAQPSSQREIADLGATLAAFPNGVKLTVKPTDFSDEQILVSVRAGRGYLDLPSDRMTPVWAAEPVLGEGGLGRLTRAQIEQVLSGDVVGTSFTTDEDAYQISGATRPEDFQLQLQLLAAYFTDAAWRPEPFVRMQGVMGQFVDQVAATPGGAFARFGSGLLAGGDKRFSYPTPQEIAGAELADLRQTVSESIAQGPIEVVIVGDVTVEDAIAAVGATFGALPARTAPVEPSPDALRVSFPAAVSEPVQLFHTGAAGQALGYVAWPTTDSIGDRTEARTANLLAEVLQLRVTDELREKQGVAYSPRAGATSSQVFPGYGYISTVVETPPEALPGFFRDLDAIAASLRETPVSEDELTRARLSTVESVRRSQATNGYWLGQLQDVHDDPTQIDAVRTIISDLEAVTPADIQRAAQTWLLPDRAWRATVTAGAPTQAAAAAH